MIESDSKTYIIIVNYNTWKDTIECLESLLKLKSSNIQIIVVDNASPNDSLFFLEEWASGKNPYEILPNALLKHLVLPLNKEYIEYETYNQEELEGKNFQVNFSCKLTFIKASHNGGFAKANNLALKCILTKKDFQYVCLLNNDTVVEPNTLEELINYYDKKTTQGLKLGILGGKILYYQQPNIIQCAGGAWYNKWLAHSKQIGNGQVDHAQFDLDQIELDLIIGACMFVSRYFLEDVGLLSEDYFLYFEEQDWAIRAKHKGWYLGYSYKAKVYHKEGASIGGNQLNLSKISRISDFYYARNKLIFTKKYHSWLCYLTVKLSFIFIITNRIKRKQFDRIPMLLKILCFPKKMYKN